MGTFPHASLTEAQAEALTILAEECAEVAQECSKVLRSGLHFNRRGGQVPNTVFLQQELADVIVLSSIIVLADILGPDDDFEDMIRLKVRKMKEWTNFNHDLLDQVEKVLVA